MIRVKDEDIVMMGEPKEIIDDFIKIVKAFSNFVKKYSVEVVTRKDGKADSVIDSDDVVCEIFCLAMSSRESTDCEFIDISKLPSILNKLREDPEDE